MKRKVLLVTLLGLTLCNLAPAWAQKAVGLSKLRVLYVGGSANWENDVFKTPEDKAKDVQRRTASFEEMLKQHFTEVKAIDAKTYTQEMSDAYDVTVIDGTPKPVAEKQLIKDAKGNVTKYIPP